MVDNNELKEYAIKCYKRVNGYSLEKAAKLFPKEFPKILMYYNQYAYEDTMKLAESMRSVAFFNDGVQAMNTIANLMKKDAEYAKRVLQLNTIVNISIETKDKNLYKIIRTVKNFYDTTMKNYLTSSISLLDGIKKFANQYGFTSILKDVRDLTIDYNNQLNEINNYVKSIDEILKPRKPRRDNDNG